MAPPGAMRPVWNAETSVVPLASICGSTSVACWPGGTVNGSELICVSVTIDSSWANAARDAPHRKRQTSVKVNEKERLRFIGICPMVCNITLSGHDFAAFYLG